MLEGYTFHLVLTLNWVEVDINESPIIFQDIRICAISHLLLNRWKWKVCLNEGVYDYVDYVISNLKVCFVMKSSIFLFDSTQIWVNENSRNYIEIGQFGMKTDESILLFDYLTLELNCLLYTFHITRQGESNVSDIKNYLKYYT